MHAVRYSGDVLIEQSKPLLEEGRIEMCLSAFPKRRPFLTTSHTTTISRKVKRTLGHAGSLDKSKCRAHSQMKEE